MLFLCFVIDLWETDQRMLQHGRDGLHNGPISTDNSTSFCHRPELGPFVQYFFLSEDMIEKANFSLSSFPSHSKYIFKRLSSQPLENDLFECLIYLWRNWKKCCGILTVFISYPLRASFLLCIRIFLRGAGFLFFLFHLFFPRQFLFFPFSPSYSSSGLSSGYR